MEMISIKLTDTSGKRPCPAELVWVEWPTSCRARKRRRSFLMDNLGRSGWGQGLSMPFWLKP